ncbi:MAG: hypothetical protein HY695_02805 [Deltaproteobacteria bacterium]|nr:hypothetical protein [Deltaproteobacteria bacterium]
MNIRHYWPGTKRELYVLYELCTDAFLMIVGAGAFVAVGRLLANLLQ